MVCGRYLCDIHVNYMAKKHISTIKTVFSLQAPTASKVFLAGDFTDWDKAPLPLKKSKEGKWEKTVALPAGLYEYRFIVDGEWQNDPQAVDRKPNPYGTENSLRLVSEG